MTFRYFDYQGRPVRMTLDDKNLPERTEVWGRARKAIVESTEIEADIFFDGREARTISFPEFAALLNELSGYVVARCDFTELTAGGCAECLRILTTGNAVDPNSAAAELPIAPVMVIAKSSHEIVGTGAIKRARVEYAAKISKRAEFVFDSKMNELGYIAVAKDHQSHGLSTRITESLLSFHDGPLWATTDTDHMKAVLRKFGFHNKGHEWTDGRDRLSLWIRD